MKSSPLLLLSVCLALACAPCSAAEAAAADSSADLDALEEGAPAPAVSDPLQGYNRWMFGVNDRIYRGVLQPVARGYEQVVPEPARRGVGRFFKNLRFPARLVSNLLQGELKGAARETGRFLVNTTVGVGGLGDPASRIDSLATPEEDLGQAFGRWGVGSGPFVVLPILGPSNPRDFVGRLGESWLDPVRYWRGDWETRTALQVTDGVQNLPATIKTYSGVKQGAVDPYTAVRNGYLQRREAQVRQHAD